MIDLNIANVVTIALIATGAYALLHWVLSALNINIPWLA